MPHTTHDHRARPIVLAALTLLLVAAPAQPRDGEAEGAGREAARPVDQREAPAPLPGRGVVVAVEVVLQDGDMPAGGGGAVDILNAPFVDSTGREAFVGAVAGDRFVWYDGAIAFLSSSVVSPVLAGGESTMGISDAGGFIYSPSIDGEDGVWSHSGLVAVAQTQAPGFPAGTLSTFHSRAQMIAGGQAYWVAGFDDGAGGGSTVGRMLNTSATASSGDIAVVLRSDDIVDGLAIDRPSGVGFDYQISNNGLHHIHDLLMDTGSTADDGAVYVDGSLVARESLPTGGGDNWDNFDAMSIDDDGGYVFSGDTDGATTSDEFIARNGVIQLREGDTVDGVELTSSASVSDTQLDDQGGAVYVWSISGGTEVLFAACDADDLADATALLATGDMVDVDGNGTADATVTDFNGSNVIGPALAAGNDGRVHLEVDLDYGGGDLEAVIALDTGCEASVIFADGFESGDTSAWSATVP